MPISSIMQSKFLSVDEETVISQVIGKIKEANNDAVLIFDKDKYLGVLDHKRLLRSDYDPTTSKVRHFLKRTPLFRGEQEIIETAYIMFQSDVECVPIEIDNKISGVLTSLDLINEASKLEETKRFKLKDFKLLELLKLQKNEPIGKALDLMIDNHIDHLLVFDEKNILYGIISFNDILKKYLGWSHEKLSSAKQTKMRGGTRSAKSDKVSWSSVPIESFSTNDNLVIINNKANLRKAVELMKNKNIHSLVVMDGKKVKGILTVKNILKAIGSLNFPENQNIFFIGLHDLNLHPHEEGDIKNMASKESEKIRRLLKHDFTMRVHFKEYEKGGKQQKYSLHLHLDSTGKSLNVSEFDWNLETALHKLFDNANNLLKKDLKRDTSR